MGGICDCSSVDEISIGGYGVWVSFCRGCFDWSIDVPRDPRTANADEVVEGSGLDAYRVAIGAWR